MLVYKTLICYTTDNTFMVNKNILRHGPIYPRYDAARESAMDIIIIQTNYLLTRYDRPYISK